LAFAEPNATTKEDLRHTVKKERQNGLKLKETETSSGEFDKTGTLESERVVGWRDVEDSHGTEKARGWTKKKE